MAASQDLGRVGGCSPGPDRSGQLGVGVEGHRNHQSRALGGWEGVVSSRDQGKIRWDGGPESFPLNICHGPCNPHLPVPHSQPPPPVLKVVPCAGPSTF